MVSFPRSRMEREHRDIVSLLPNGSNKEKMGWGSLTVMLLGDVTVHSAFIRAKLTGPVARSAYDQSSRSIRVTSLLGKTVHDLWPAVYNYCLLAAIDDQ